MKCYVTRVMFNVHLERERENEREHNIKCNFEKVLKRGIKDLKTRCYWKIISFRMATVTLLHARQHHIGTFTPLLNIFLQNHISKCFIHQLLKDIIEHRVKNT